MKKIIADIIVMTIKDISVSRMEAPSSIYFLVNICTLSYPSYFSLCC